MSSDLQIHVFWVCFFLAVLIQSFFSAFKDISNRFCILSLLRILRKAGHSIPLSALRHDLAFPLLVFGPVALFHGCQV